MTPTKDEKGSYFCVSFQDVFEVVFGHKQLICSNRINFNMVFFDVFIKSLVLFYIDFKALDSTNFHDFCFSELGQAVGRRFFELFTMPSTFIFSPSTVVDIPFPDSI